MAVAGCSNYSAIASVYVLGLSYQNASGNGLDITQTHMSETLRQQIGSAELAVRVGYFGMCVQQPGGLWLCSSSADELLEQIGGNNDPLALIKTGSKFREEVLFSPMLFISVVLSCLAMLLLATFPGWHEETDERTGSLVDVETLPVQACITGGIVVFLHLFSAHVSDKPLAARRMRWCGYPGRISLLQQHQG